MPLLNNLYSLLPYMKDYALKNSDIKHKVVSAIIVNGTVRMIGENKYCLLRDKDTTR